MGKRSTRRSAFAGSRKRTGARLTVGVPRGLAGWNQVPVTAAVIAGLLAATVGVQAEERKPRKVKPATAVETVMDRQIRNAVDAGDGDLLTRSLRQKVVEQPGNVDARLALGTDYERQGADELAIEHYRIAAGEYGSEIAASRLARTLDRLGESDQAVEVLVRFCDSHAAASSRILSELGILEDEMNRQSGGEQYHRRALGAALVESAPGQDALHSNLGYNLISQKKFVEAEQQLRVALELNPRSETARNNLALALSSAPAATAAQVTEAILQWQSLSGPAAAHNNLAAVYLEQSRYAEARRELERALAFDRANGAALKNLETLATLDGKPAQVTAPVPMEVAQAPLPKKTNLLRRLFSRKHPVATSAVAEVAHQRKQTQRQ